MYRRDFAKQLGAVLLAGTLTRELQATPQESSPSTTQTNVPPALSPGPLQIAMLVYPGMTALDLVAPQTIFTELKSSQVELVLKSKETVTSDTGIRILPTMTFADCPADLDILFVGGGHECIGADERSVGNRISSEQGCKGKARYQCLHGIACAWRCWPAQWIQRHFS